MRRFGRNQDEEEAGKQNNEKKLSDLNKRIVERDFHAQDEGINAPENEHRIILSYILMQSRDMYG